MNAGLTQAANPRLAPMVTHLWGIRSAEQGQLNAQFSLGILYYDGRSTKVGTKEARKWLETAAEQGDAHAQYIMAGLYLDDTSGESQSARAIELFEKAAAQGHVYAVGRLPGITATANGAAQ